MTRRSVVHVHVASKDGTRRQWLAPGDQVPDWAALDDRNLAPEAAPAGAGPSQAPARAGRGSGLKEWRAFAGTHGVEVAPDAGRDDVITACERAGLVAAED